MYWLPLSYMCTQHMLSDNKNMNKMGGGGVIAQSCLSWLQPKAVDIIIDVLLPLAKTFGLK